MLSFTVERVAESDIGALRFTAKTATQTHRNHKGE